MIDNILISDESSNFFKLFRSENNNTKPIRLFINNIVIPFGLEEYKNKYIINFEINDTSKEFENFIRNLERNIPEYIENEDIDIKSVFYKKQNFPLMCRGNIKMNRNKFITIYRNNENKEMSLFDLKKKLTYDLELEVSGIWKYRNTSGIYINIISLKDNF